MAVVLRECVTSILVTRVAMGGGCLSFILSDLSGQGGGRHLAAALLCDPTMVHA